MLSDVIAAHDAGGDWESLWEVFFQNLHESSSLGQGNNPSRGKNDGGSAKAVPSAETASAAPAPVAEADTNGTAISPPSPSSESDDASNPLAGDLSKLMHQLAIARTCVQQQYLWNTKGMGFGMPPAQFTFVVRAAWEWPRTGMVRASTRRTASRRPVWVHNSLFTEDITTIKAGRAWAHIRRQIPEGAVAHRMRSSRVARNSRTGKAAGTEELTCATIRRTTRWACRAVAGDLRLGCASCTCHLPRSNNRR